MRNGLTVGIVAALAASMALPNPAGAQTPGSPVAGAPGPAAAPVPGVAVDPPARVGVLAQLAGVVSFHLADATRWEAASLNLPVTTGGAFWTQPGARAAIEVSGTRLSMDASTELDVVQLDARTLTASVPQGRIYIRVRALPDGETEVVETPRGIVRLLKPGRYEVDAGDTTRPTVLTVVDGEADLQPAGVDTQTDGTVVHVGPNQAATITGDGQTAPYAVSLGTAGRDPFLTAMLAAEAPPRTTTAAPAYVARYTGGEALEEYGAWSTVPTYGAVWYPPEATYIPYRRGHWAYVAPWGWTWVDDAPWGFAPSHYGRWLQVQGRWGWLPGGEAASTPVYAPAVVSFLGGVALGSAIGWVPLGPGEAYYPPYRVNPGYVRSLNQGQVNNVSLVETNYTNSFNRTGVLPREPFANRAAAIAVPAAAMLGSRSLTSLIRPVPAQGVVPFGLRAPLSPGRGTVGVTQGVARQFNLPASPVALPSAPGPALRAQAAGPGRTAPVFGPTLPGLRLPGGQGGFRANGGAPGPALQPGPSPEAGPGRAPVAPPPPEPGQTRPIEPGGFRPQPGPAAHPGPVPGPVTQPELARPNTPRPDVGRPPAPPPRVEQARPLPNVVRPPPIAPQARPEQPRIEHAIPEPARPQIQRPTIQRPDIQRSAAPPPQPQHAAPPPPRPEIQRQPPPPRPGPAQGGGRREEHEEHR